MTSRVINRKHNLFIILLLIPVLFLILCCVSNQVSGNEIFISPSVSSITPNEEFCVNVTCHPTQSIKSYELKINFDPDFIQVNSLDEGSFFNGFNTFFNTGIINNEAGTITGIYNLIIGPGNVSSNGTFIQMNCTSLSNFGSSLIDFYEIGITNETSYIPFSSENGTIQIQDFINMYTPMPSNKSSMVDNNLDSISIIITQSSGELFNYSIVTNPDIGSKSASFQSNGTKTCAVSNLAYNTQYNWTVSVEEINSNQWMNRSFFFTTEPFTVEDVLLLSSPIPSNQSTSVSIDTSSVRVDIIHENGGLFNYSIVTSPDIGNCSAVNQNNGTKTCVLSDLEYDTRYDWMVSIQDNDSEEWINRSFWFQVESAPGDDDDDDGSSGGRYFPPPPVEDENNAPYQPVKPSGPVYIEPGGTFSYSAQTYDPDGDQIRYRFNWDDGSLSEWTDFKSGNETVTLSHSWDVNANFSLTVLAQDEEGLNSSWSESLLVFCSFAENESDQVNPVASFSFNSTDPMNQSVVFNASESYDEDGNISYYYWYFGDGTTSTEMNPQHTYAEPGWYNVTLLVTDDDGNMYSKTMQIYAGSTSDKSSKQTTFSTFPWLFILVGIGIVCVGMIMFRKQLFAVFVETEEEHYHDSSDEILVKKNENDFVKRTEVDVKDIDYIRNHIDQLFGKNDDEQR